MTFGASVNLDSHCSIHACANRTDRLPCHVDESIRLGRHNLADDFAGPSRVVLEAVDCGGQILGKIGYAVYRGLQTVRPSDSRSMVTSTP